jgi:hypothetical protein
MNLNFETNFLKKNNEKIIINFALNIKATPCHGREHSYEVWILYIHLHLVQKYYKREMREIVWYMVMIKSTLKIN